MTKKLIQTETVCASCGHRKGDARYEYYCDGCGKQLPPEDKRITLGEHRSDNDDDCGITWRHFCDWSCLLKWLPSVQWSDVEAILLPNLHGNELIEAVRKVSEGETK